MNALDFMLWGLGIYVGLVAILVAVILFMDWTERWGVMLCPTDCDDDCQNCDRFPEIFKVQAD
jgi:hypothetical protein